MDNKKKEKNKKPSNKFNNYWIYGVLAMVFLVFNIFQLAPTNLKKLDTGGLMEMLHEEKVEKIVVINGQKANIYVKEENLDEYFDRGNAPKNGPHFYLEVGSLESFSVLVKDAQEGNKNIIYVNPENQPDYFGQILGWVLPLFIIIALWMFVMRRMGGGGGPGSQIFSIGKSKATLFDKNTKVNVTFEDVAGLEEAKVEVMEVVDFLTNPKKYTALGGKIPKGVLLVGPPGTGKTLLAKAVAGEAKVPFFSISGSDFVEMFVGVGASRVRDLFKQAREKAPCIIFIDEIDAIGRARGKGNFTGGNDERENTLNQLLVEMDGFSTDKGVILMAATNRPDVLDSALLRPGRFDRQIGIDKPDATGREAIFKVHLKDIKTDGNLNPKTLAEMTPGFAGAEIANVCNEAALVAARRDKKAVELDDFNYALDRVIGGLEKKNKLISPMEKNIISYHEAGHAVCGWFLEHAHPLVKVTIVPRGIGTLGYAQYLPKERYITRTEALLDQICMTMGGRAAEYIMFGKISTGAQNDLDQVTKMAYGMITYYGMNEKVGQVSFAGMSEGQFQKPYSNETAKIIDEEVRNLIEKQYTRAKKLLTDKKEQLEILAQKLLTDEVLLKSDVIELIGERPYPEDKIVIKPEAEAVDDLIDDVSV